MNDFYKVPYYIHELAKKLRKNQTLAEKILWSYLKNKQFYGFNFYRQKPIFVYRENECFDRFFIADFYHHSSKLIIELDGSIHLKYEVIQYDDMRDYLLTNLSYNIIRFKNSDIINNTNQSLSTSILIIPLTSKSLSS